MTKMKGNCNAYEMTLIVFDFLHTILCIYIYLEEDTNGSYLRTVPKRKRG